MTDPLGEVQQRVDAYLQGGDVDAVRDQAALPISLWSPFTHIGP